MSGSGDGDPVGRAAALVGLFVRPPDAFGTIAAVDAADVPDPARSLLDHESHMTVVMERRHGGPVRLRVVAETDGPGDHYAREIVLLGPDGEAVQFGIVRIDLAAVDAATAARIRLRTEPLGRILTDANILCDVGDVALVRVVPGPHLGHLIGPRATYGRVAGIALATRPAVELLEIVAAG